MANKQPPLLIRKLPFLLLLIALTGVGVTYLAALLALADVERSQLSIEQIDVGKQ